MIKLEIPFLSLEQICDSGQCFRMQKEADGNYSLIASGRYLRAGQRERQLFLYCSQEEYETVWKFYFDLDTDYGRFLSAVKQDDPYLMEASQSGCGIRILRQDIWEMIVSFLISQQNNIKRIRGCIDTVCRKYGEEKRTDEGTLYYTFPTPEALSQVSEEEFRACGLGYRSRYLVKTAQMAAGGEIDLDALKKMDYLKARETLMLFSGVGEKVADCICLFALHHLDSFPVDTHIAKVLKEHYKEGFPFEEYKGFSGVLQQYVFYHDLIKGKKESGLPEVSR